MRYLLQIAIPALITGVIVYLLVRRRRESSATDESDALGIVLLFVAGMVVAGLAFLSAVELAQ
ncbi:MAG: hypothetical protein ACO3Z6_13805 [Pseudomonadales bacterium]|jgi:cytochrome c oxidase assembly factor CtaG